MYMYKYKYVCTLTGDIEGIDGAEQANLTGERNWLNRVTPNGLHGIGDLGGEPSPEVKEVWLMT